MNKLIRNYIVKIIFLTLILCILSGMIFYFFLKYAYFNSFPFVVILFPVISVLVHIQLLKASEKSLAKFNVVFMLSFMIKLIVYAIFAAVLISADSEHKNSFVITMLLFYLIYTIFETKTILSDIKKIILLNK